MNVHNVVKKRKRIDFFFLLFINTSVLPGFSKNKAFKTETVGS